MIPQPIDQVPLFLRLSQEERELVTARLRRRPITSGEVVFAAGQPSDGFFVIASGWIKLENSSSDRSLTLATLGAGSLLGEVDALLGRPYTITARAAAATQLLAICRPDLEDLISQHPNIGLKFSAALGMRVTFLERYLVQQRLRNIELLSSLSEDDLLAIANHLEFKACGRGEIIVQAGAPGQAVYFIEEGEARQISKSSEGESYEELSEGSVFGHTSLITGKPYPATVRAVTDVSLWVLPRSVYLDLVREQPSIKLAFSRALAETLGPGDQTDAVEQIRRLELFSDVPTEALSALVGRLVLRQFPAGDIVYTEGTPGDALYVVEAGEVKLLDSAFSDARLLERMRAGDSFGEMALLTGRTRAECARASTDSTLWVLYKTDFDDLMVQYPEISVSLSRALTERLTSRENDFLVRHLQRITLFSNLAVSELRLISGRIRGLRFRPGEIICFAGQPAENLFMIEMGEVKRYGTGPSGEPVMVDLLGPGDCFGEQAIVQNSAYPTTAQAIGELELWTIAKTDFLGLMEQFPALAMTVTRLMADRLARSQNAPTVRYPPPAHPGQPSQRPGTPPPPQGGQPRPNSPLPRPRIQQPRSGARPINRPPVNRPPQSNPPRGNSDNDPTVIMPSVRTPQSPRGNGDTDPTVIMPGIRTPQTPRSDLSPMRPDDSTVVLPYRGRNLATDSTVVLPRPRADVAAASTVRIPPRPAGRAHPRRTGPGQFMNELVGWVAGLSLGAKLRVATLSCLVAWFAFIAFPATAITTVSSAVNGLQIFNPGVSQNGTPEANQRVALVRTTTGGKSPKVAYAVMSPTPLPTKTPLPVPATATRPRATSVPVTRAPAVPTAVVAVAPAATPIPALPPIYWDQRIGNGAQVLPHLESVRIIPANVAHGQKFWRAVSVKFEDISESGNDHTIYVQIRDENGKRVEGKTLQVTSDTTGEIFPDQPNEKSDSDVCNCNYGYPMYGDGYNVQIVGDAPSDKVAGMVMPMKRHVNYKIILQLTLNP